MSAESRGRKRSHSGSHSGSHTGSDSGSDTGSYTDNSDNTAKLDDTAFDVAYSTTKDIEQLFTDGFAEPQSPPRAPLPQPKKFFRIISSSPGHDNDALVSSSSAMVSSSSAMV